ncbi:protein CFAP20DC [Amia ocellicauda]|uniref:protein CFAP20DC n=1 Tax=Amia ocellicauda TaxID=2972642 RepID=UPI00346404DC
MFKNEYQGGPMVDIFSAQGKDPVAKWKLFGSQTAIWKDFDKEVKSFVYVLEGSGQTSKMQIPKDNKMALGLIQRYLILQIYVPLGKDFSTELMITDLGNLKRRLYLSTVHKELSATPLHAKIPLSGVKRSTWCNMCIDLGSFTTEVFKGAAFLSLDGIIVSACCKLRKIFTMKIHPQDTLNVHGLYISSPTDIIPRSCQFPADVRHVTQVINMDNLRLAEIKFSGSSLFSECEQTSSSRSASARGSKNQDASHIAFGSRVQGPPPVTGRRTSATGLREMDSSGGNNMSKTYCQERESSVDRSERQTKQYDVPSARHLEILQGRTREDRQPSQLFPVKPHIIQPHPPQDQSTERTGKRKLRVPSVGKEQSKPPCNTGTGQSQSGTRGRSSEKSVHPLCRRVNSEEAVTPGKLQKDAGDQTADKWHSSDQSEDSIGSNSSGQALVGLQAVSPDLYLPMKGSDREDSSGDEGIEPQLKLKDIFTYSSRPHSAKHRQQSVPVEVFLSLSASRGDGDSDQRGARLEDDFLGGDSEEDEVHFRFFGQDPILQSSSNSSAWPYSEDTAQLSRGPDLRSARDSLQTNPAGKKMPLGGFAPLKTADREKAQTSVVPIRSLSPAGTRRGEKLDHSESIKIASNGQDNKLRTSLSRKSLKEIRRDESRQNIDNSEFDWRNYRPTRMSASELHMLASLRRQQDEELQDESNSPGLSASQIDNCNVSISTSSDDTTTWNSCRPPPVNQGHHYQKEMNPLLHSNPRDWLNVFSPPIIPPSQQMREQAVNQTQREISKGNEIAAAEDTDDDEVLNLLYDPCLNCYFDPETGKYYELA